MRTARGWSLIELLVTMGVIAILATIAIGSYRNYGLRTNRVDGTTSLMRIQVAEEKYFLQNNTYTTDVSDPAPAGLGLGSNNSPNGYYALAVVAGATGSIATSYSATATAQGTQTKDTSCPVFTINDQGARSPATSTGCWK
ncbi:MAG: type IV pilin protein [Proteobacteria bacterium]|nr:type IV pilin protein [Pseudomonadota bacterium]